MKRFGFVSLVACVSLASWLAYAPVHARQGADDTAELVERERLRSTIENALALMGSRPHDRDAAREDYERATEMILDLGPAAIDFFIPEIENPDPQMFFFVAYISGRIGAPEAVEPLLRAMQVADEEGGHFARKRKAWCGLALALLGEVRAIDLLDQGKTLAARTELYHDMTALEAAAVLTAPESVPLLLAQLERYRDDEERADRRWLSLAALRHTGDPRALQAARRYLDDEDLRVREHSLEILAAMGTEEDGDRIFAAFEDPAPLVRYKAAEALARVLPRKNGALQTIARLEIEDNPYIRGRLYAALAELRGVDALPVLQRAAGRGDPLDRLQLLKALATLPVDATAPIVKTLVGDPDVRVARAAMDALGRSADPSVADVLLAEVRNANFSRADAAIKALLERNDPRVGPRVAARLLRSELSEYRVSAASRTRVRELASALVRCRFVAAIEDLDAAAASIDDLEVADVLRDTVRKLSYLREHGDNRRRWVEQIERQDDEDLRRLAYGRVAELGNKRDLDRLVRRFASASDDDKVELLRLVAKHRLRAGEPIVREVLSGADYDLATRHKLRAMGAFAAYRIGTPAMHDALERSAERRRGLDYPVLVYLALSRGPAVAERIASYKANRIIRFKHDRALEQEQLDWIVSQLRRQRSVAKFDGPPEHLHFDV